MRKLKEKLLQKIAYVREAYTDEQRFSLFLTIAMIIITLFMAIIRLCGILWFDIDFSEIKLPNSTQQNIIKFILLVFEMSFCYKIVLGRRWTVCILFAGVHSTLASIIPYPFNMICANLFWIGISCILRRDLACIVDILLLYIFMSIYSLLFVVGRIGGIDNTIIYSYYYTVLGAIDYKLFIVSLYLIIKQFGGIKLWKRKFLTAMNKKSTSLSTHQTAHSCSSETINP